MADNKKKKKKKGPMGKFADNLTGRGGNPSKPGGPPKGAVRGTNTSGKLGYFDPQTGKFYPDKKR